MVLSKLHQFSLWKQWEWTQQTQVKSRVSMYQQTFPINSTGKVGMSPGSGWKVWSDSIHGKHRGSVSPTDDINRTSKAGKVLGQSLHAVKVQLFC